jgi:hypothetical protein
MPIKVTDKIKFCVRSVQNGVRTIYWMQFMQIISNRWRKYEYGLFAMRLCNPYAKFFGLALIAIFSVQQAAATEKWDRRDIVLNQAYEISLPENAASVLLGNADIADIISQTSESVVISGKRVGQTNLLVRDRAQKLIGNIGLNIKAAETTIITLYRGTTRADYNCNNACAMASSVSDAASPNSQKNSNDDGQASIK